MTLHEAIEKLLKERARPMTTKEIAEALNQYRWYKKKDGSTITSGQVSLRVKKYPLLFSAAKSTISLSQSSTTKGHEPKSTKTSKEVVKSIPAVYRNTLLPSVKVDSHLMREQVFKSPAAIDSFVLLNTRGIYCIRVKDPAIFPKRFTYILKVRSHNIIYIGIATRCLNTRFLQNELRGGGHGTFFRSIGAILGYRPLTGSLIDKANKRNYKFTSADSAKIVDWINQNLLVNWVSVNGDLEAIETDLLHKYQPLLNLAKNPGRLKILSDLRAECVRVANCT